MSHKLIFGFQWCLAFIYIIVGAAGALTALSGYQAARYFGMELITALVLDERTVKTHVTHLLEKLNLRDRTQLAIYAYQNNLIAE